MWHQKPPLGTSLNFAHPLARGLVGYWIFNENGGDRVADLSGNGNTAVLTNMNPATDWVPGKDGPALDFDGNDATLTLTKQIKFDDNYSIVWWVNYDVVTQTRYIGTTGLHNSLVLATATTMWIRTNDGGYLVFNVDSHSAGQWYQNVVTRDGSGNWRWYINGKESSSGPTNDPDYLLIDSIGRASTGNLLDGKILSVSIYERTLSSEDTVELYTNPYSMFALPNVAMLYAEAAPPPGAAIPVFSKNGIHSLVFGGQIITG